MPRRKQSQPKRMKCGEGEDGNSVGNSPEKEDEKDVPRKKARLTSTSSESQSDSDQMDNNEQDPPASPQRPVLRQQQHLSSVDVKSDSVTKDSPCEENLALLSPKLEIQNPSVNNDEITLTETKVSIVEKCGSPTRSKDVGVDLSQKHNVVADIRTDSDQPLDLSLKPWRAKQSSHERVQLPRPISPELPSSLASLEKKFGEGAFKFEGLGSKLSTNVKPKMLERFNTSAFRNALFGLPVSSTSFVEKSLKPNIPSASPKGSTGSIKHLSTNNNNNKEVSEPIKHTDFECSCKRLYKTLYELSIHMQETGHTPKSNKNASYMEYPKLVRGQDMWLNQGMEQTRQILCCMTCSESFKSLPELTVHMMQTRHYANIVSTEGRGKSHKCSAYCDKCTEDQSVFKCKVCSDVFTDMEALANHMVVSGHHKKQTEKANMERDNEPSRNCKEGKHSAVNGNAWKAMSGSSTVASLLEKNKQNSRKSMDAENSDSTSNGLADSEPESSSEANRIRCENCNEKIDTCKFVEHVRRCIKTKSRVLSALKARLKTPEEDAGMNNSLSRHIKKEKISDEGNNEIENHRAAPSGLRSSPVAEDYLSSSPPPPLLNSSVSQNSSGQALLNYTSDIGGSALKAMESFIERSFTPSKPKKSRNRTQSQMYPPIYSMDYSPSVHSRPLASLEKLQSSFIQSNTTKVEKVVPDSTASETGAAPGGVKQEEQSEPRHQSVIKATHRKRYNQEVKSHPPFNSSTLDDDEAYDGDNDDSSKIGSPAKESVTKEEKDSPSPVSTKSDGAVSESERTDSKEDKYVCDTSSDISSSKSALESLQGLVYSHSFATEHPLDSLQRLIHTTHGHNHIHSKSDTVVTMVPSTAASSSGTLTSSIPSTVILVNPIVTVLPHSSLSSTTQVQITIPDHVSSSPDPNRAGPKSGGGDSDSEGGGEFCCQACSRTFVSKGSYRYHLSRCHLSSVKKYGFKEAFNMSPYVYLPLDHTAKFSKYYKMANELANKSKNGD